MQEMKPNWHNIKSHWESIKRLWTIKSMRQRWLLASSRPSGKNAIAFSNGWTMDVGSSGAVSLYDQNGLEHQLGSSSLPIYVHATTSGEVNGTSSQTLSTWSGWSVLSTSILIIVIQLGSVASDVITSVTDSQSNAVTKIGSYIGPQNMEIAYYAILSPSSGSHTVTINYSTTPTGTATMTEMACIDINGKAHSLEVFSHNSIGSTASPETLEFSSAISWLYGDYLLYFGQCNGSTLAPTANFPPSPNMYISWNAGTVPYSYFEYGVQAFGANSSQFKVTASAGSAMVIGLLIIRATN